MMTHGLGPLLSETGGVIAMRHRLDYAWRLIGTGFSFAFFGLGGLVLALIVIPIMAAASPNDVVRRSRTQGLIHSAFRLFVAVLIFLRIIDFNPKGHDRLRKCRGKIIIANHPSLLDAVLLMSLMPKAQCVVKYQLWTNRFLRGVVRAAGYIRNDLESELLIEQCKEILDNGENIVLFPEGTRTVPGKPIKFKRGFANIATLAGADLQLVTITCDPTTLTKGEPWYKIPSQRPQFSVTVREQVDIQEYVRREVRTLAVRRLTRDLEQYYAGQLSFG